MLTVTHIARRHDGYFFFPLSLRAGFFRSNVVYIEASCTSFTLRDFFIIYRGERLGGCRLHRRGRNGGRFGFGCRRLCYEKGLRGYASEEIGGEPA